MITYERLIEVVNYNPSTGFFFNKKTRGGIVPEIPSGSKSSYGYIRIKLDGKSYMAHRLAWLFMFKEIPLLEIDHINGDRSCNKIENLRLATKSQNQHNARLRKDNTSGLKGAYKMKNGKFISIISCNKTRHYLGCFETAEKAHNAYVSESLRLHKEFRNDGKSGLRIS